MITELFYSYKEFQEYTAFRYGLIKNGFADPKSFRGFRETGPRSELEGATKREMADRRRKIVLSHCYSITLLNEMRVQFLF